MLDINTLIAEAMKKREKERLETLKLIKTEFVKVEKSGVAVDEDKQIKILLKMVEQREESIKQYTKADRFDLAEHEAAEIKVIKEFLPAMPTEEDIVNETKAVIEEIVKMNDADWKLSMKDMKAILTKVQEKYPTANGGIVSKVLKEHIG